MRTIKALACAAALVAGLATAVAQSNVYSLNVVGYYNVTVPQSGWYVIANQLNTTNNQLQYVMPNPADGTVLFKYIGGGWQATTFSFGVWDQPEWTMNPGEAAFVNDPGTPGGQTITFVGEVLQGSQTNPVGLLLGDGLHNWSFVSSMVPQQGTPTDFNVPAEESDSMFVYNGGWVNDGYSFGAWGANSGAGMTIDVGQGFAYLKGPGNTSSTWVRNFTVQ